MQPILLAGAVGLWAALHSWLASNQAKRLAAKKFGRRGVLSYRLLYNLLSVLTLAPIALLMRELPDRMLYRVAQPWSFIMLGGQLISMMLLLLALFQADTLHFAGISQLFGRQSRSNLITGGFYGLVRHPLYLFGLLVLWLTPVMTLNQLAVFVVLTLYLFIGASLEERRLLHEFGNQYEEYRSRTPMIIPAFGLGTSRRRSQTGD